MSVSPVDVGEATAVKRRSTGLAKVACFGCRRLKMKCITVSDHGPCLRCAKADRKCILPPTKQASSRQSSAVSTGYTTPVTPVSAPPYGTQAPPLPGMNSGMEASDMLHGGWAIQGFPPLSANPIIQPGLTSPAYMNWQMPSSFTQNHQQHPDSLDVDSGSHMQSEPSSYSPEDVSSDGNVSMVDSPVDDCPVSTEELQHLIKFFCSNLLDQVLVLEKEDVEDVNVLLNEKRPLALCISYVAAQFVPGCRSICTRLAPTISLLATLQSNYATTGPKDDARRWSLLQALAVLYTWAPSQDPDEISQGRLELTRDMLRVSMDTLSARYSLHKSVQDVAECLQTMPLSDVRQSFAFRRYTYWLWLYIAAHYKSLVSQTPSIMREDASITQAGEILEGFRDDRYVNRILAQVELCLIWVRSWLRERNFGEWHCSTPNRLTTDDMAATLRELDDRLQNWSTTWASPTRPLMDQSILSIYQHFIHFCSASYISQTSRASSAAPSGPSPNVFETQALERAWSLCAAFRDISPLSKSLIGYNSDTPFAMVAFCCDRLIRAQTKSTDSEASATTSPASVVLDVAELMIELGPYETHSSKLLGRRLLSTYDNYRPHKPVRPPHFRTQSHGLKPALRLSVGANPRSLHRRTCSADVLSHPYVVGGGGSSNGRSRDGGTESSISLSPERGAVIPYGPPNEGRDGAGEGMWSAAPAYLHSGAGGLQQSGMEVPRTTTTAATAGLMAPPPSVVDADMYGGAIVMASGGGEVGGGGGVRGDEGWHQFMVASM